MASQVRDGYPSPFLIVNKLGPIALLVQITIIVNATWYSWILQEWLELSSNLATSPEVILRLKLYLTLLAIFADNPVEVEAIDKGSHGITRGMSNQTFLQHFLQECQGAGEIFKYKDIQSWLSQCFQFYLHDFYCNALRGDILHSADQPMYNLSTDEAVGRQAPLLWQKLHSSAARTEIQFISHTGDIIED